MQDSWSNYVPLKALITEKQNAPDTLSNTIRETMINRPIVPVREVGQVVVEPPVVETYAEEGEVTRRTSNRSRKRKRFSEYMYH